MKTKLFFILALLTLSQLSMAKLTFTNLDYKFEMIDILTDINFNHSDLEVLQVEEKSNVSMGGFGEFKTVYGYKVLIKVIDKHFNKRFVTKGKIIPFQFIKDLGAYDLVSIFVRDMKDLKMMTFYSDFKINNSYGDRFIGEKFTFSIELN